jgi:hypothetical protein
MFLVRASGEKMTAKSDIDGAKQKQPYVKPEVRRVVLRPEEAVLAACKTSKISGPGASRCNLPSPCSSMRS